MTLQITSYRVAPGSLPLQMAKSQGTAMRLLKLGAFGADLIRFAPGCCVEEHVHPGDHVLVVVSGSGWLRYGGTTHDLTDGMLYMVPGSTPHAIGAYGEEMTLISVANDHRDPVAEDRLELTQ